jgi:hypothetical protein
VFFRVPDQNKPGETICWTWIAPPAVAAAVCLARIRLTLRVEIRETGAAAYAGVRLAGFIPAGTLVLEMRTQEKPTITLSWRIFKARLRVALDMKRFREIAGRRGPALRQWLSPALNGDVLRRAFRVQSLRIDVRTCSRRWTRLMCVWAGARRRSGPGRPDRVRFDVGFRRERARS